MSIREPRLTLRASSCLPFCNHERRRLHCPPERPRCHFNCCLLLVCEIFALHRRPASLSSRLAPLDSASIYLWAPYPKHCLKSPASQTPRPTRSVCECWNVRLSTAFCFACVMVVLCFNGWETKPHSCAVLRELWRLPLNLTGTAAAEYEQDTNTISARTVTKIIRADVTCTLAVATVRRRSGEAALRQSRNCSV
jgi:hypothetical protein